MVQVETTELTATCSGWRDQLHKLRDEFTRYREQLQKAFLYRLTPDKLLTVERLQNQFHIQLINIHDLRHRIKSHSRHICDQVSKMNGYIRDESLALHDYLYEDYQRLTETLDRVRQEYRGFMIYT